MPYEIKLDIFEGPLDLLLFLIKKNELNIYDIPITYITQEYMRYIEMMERLDLDIAGEYIVMAATLMQIKSRMLLPAPPKDEEEEAEDPRQGLVDMLLEYQMFREAGIFLRTKEYERQLFFERRANIALLESEADVNFDITGNMFDLLTHFSRSLKLAPQKKVYEIYVEHFTVEQKVHDILHLLVKTDRLKASYLFSQARSSLEVIVTFLAMLELAKRQEIHIYQEANFGEIEIARRGGGGSYD